MNARKERDIDKKMFVHLLTKYEPNWRWISFLALFIHFLLYIISLLILCDARDESDLVDGIVEDISKKLIKFCLDEFDGLVGIDQNIEKIESLLKMESNEVLFVGI